MKYNSLTPLQSYLQHFFLPPLVYFTLFVGFAVFIAITVIFTALLISTLIAIPVITLSTNLTAVSIIGPAIITVTITFITANANSLENWSWS